MNHHFLFRLCIAANNNEMNKDWNGGKQYTEKYMRLKQYMRKKQYIMPKIAINNEKRH